MLRLLTRLTVVVLVWNLGLVVPALAQSAPTAAPIKMQTVLVNDVANLSEKFTGLARVMAGKYDWRPGAGVRSVGEVLNLIVTENRMLATLLTADLARGRGGRGDAGGPDGRGGDARGGGGSGGGEAPTPSGRSGGGPPDDGAGRAGRGGRGGAATAGNEPLTDPSALLDALRSSYATLQQAIGTLSDAQLDAGVRMFGRDTTKQGAALMLLFDQHEHLGQSIAYARSNGVVPPWSK